MYIDIETVNAVAKLIGSMAVIGGVLIALYKFVERDKKQSKLIKDIQTEQTLLCYGIKACLQGLAASSLSQISAFQRLVPNMCQ